jgi:glycosyl transferase family 25
MKEIDAVLYINLKHREDRNSHILNEIRKMNIDASKIHRIDAVMKDIGALGCGYSHIKALQYAIQHPEWETVLILEDDFTFKDISIQDSIHTLLNYASYSKAFDIGLLAHNHETVIYKNTSVDCIKRITFAQTTSAYIIKKHYISTLLTNFMEAMGSMYVNGKKHENCIDVHWSYLMCRDYWFCIAPSIGYQCESYSDIEYRMVNYRC